MTLKFSGTSMEFALRWYNTETGEAIQKPYSSPYDTEIDFSRNVLKTKPIKLSLHPEHVPDKHGFWINGCQADKNKRITFATGTKNKLVISKNEVDFMFCTTNQPYASCYRLQNNTENALEKMQKCEGIYIVYLTQQDAEYIWKDTTYTHPKMSGRAFLYESVDKRHYLCGRPYGKLGFEIRDALRKWFPNGLEIGWELSEEQLDNARFERDNFEMDGKAIHDRWDEVFNTGDLYYTDGIPFVINGKCEFEERIDKVNDKKRRLLNAAKRNEGQKNVFEEIEPPVRPIF